MTQPAPRTAPPLHIRAVDANVDHHEAHEIEEKPAAVDDVGA